MARVLIVEDGEDTRGLLTLLFRREGCEVEAVENGLGAMRAYWQALEERRPFGLVIMDLAMPGMDGITTCKRIRSAEAEIGLRRVTINGYTGHEDKLHSQEAVEEAGFDSVTIKPGDMKEFQRWARELKERSLAAAIEGAA